MAAPTVSSRPHSILFDSGANCCITNNINDFNGNYTPFNKNKSIESMRKSLSADGYGEVAWSFIADDGSSRTLKLPAYLIKTATQKIASTGLILGKYPKENIAISQTELRLSGLNQDPPLT
eukprot:scaffold1746_cov97-Amphora_coffeaeformis.AAC.1